MLPQSDSEAPRSAAHVDGADAGSVTTSFGAFKPVGHVMVGVPTQALADALFADLQAAGWPAAAVRQFAPQEGTTEWQSMVENAGPLAGFGHEIALLRRYLSLTKEGYRWLLVPAGDSERAAAAAAIAREGGATLAVHYRSLTVEDLIA